MSIKNKLIALFILYKSDYKKMNVLMVSRDCMDLFSQSSNVYRQAHCIANTKNVNIEVLTWPYYDKWSGEQPTSQNQISGVPYHQFHSSGMKFHVIAPQDEWHERTLSPDLWERAVSFGEELLDRIQPDIVHLQHWFGLWWILESAQRKGIPTVYTNHDWGIACQRTVLLNGAGKLCDGVVSAEKCSDCIFEGRGFIGRVNEKLVNYKFGSRLMETAFKIDLTGILQKKGAVKSSVMDRSKLHLSRVVRIMSKVNHVFTPSNFGKRFFGGLGVGSDRISVIPWYHDPCPSKKTPPETDKLVITYVGRVSPEKGLDVLFEAISHVNQPIILRIIGADESKYCSFLRSRYGTEYSGHMIQWVGWTKTAEEYLLKTDVAVVPSNVMDNTPLTLIEAFSHKVPVIVVKIPTIMDLVQDGITGYLFEPGSPASLAGAISCAQRDVKNIRKYSNTAMFPNIFSLSEYVCSIVATYSKILKLT